MLVRALNFDGFVDDPHWVYRWRDHVWGTKGVSHFYGPDHPASSCRMVMHHILDRLGVEAMWAPDLRHPAHRRPGSGQSVTGSSGGGAQSPSSAASPGR